ncbi:restriction endonuclease subunit S [Thalassospira sp.]|uniref:restriction endonuclease subunit S n=1 Tax=Thalassospira sp. TaxID=1912094 RepID=UPI00311DCB39
MNASLSNVTLASVCTKVTDGTHDSPKLQLSGIPFIKAKHVSQGKIDFNFCDYITYEDHLKVIARSKPEFGDTLFVNIGASLGDAVFVPNASEFSIKNVALFKPNPSKIDPRYLYYVVLSPAFQSSIKNKRSGSAQPFVGLDTLRQQQISIHECLTTQRRIASILSAYDDLIENNTRRIAILEEMARRLYEEWFVHFRFPGHEDAAFIETEDGRVPEGWEYKPLGELYKTSSGGTPNRKNKAFYGGDIRWIKTKELLDGPIFESEEKITELGLAKSSAKIFPRHSVVVAMYGATIGQLGVLMHEASTNQACCALLPDEQGLGWEYAFLTLLNRRSELIDLRTGAAQQNISQAIIKSFPVLKPSENSLTLFKKSVSPLLQQSFLLLKKNNNLQAQRDLLLPKLISGEIDVSKAEEVVGGEAA